MVKFMAMRVSNNYALPRINYIFRLFESTIYTYTERITCVNMRTSYSQSAGLWLFLSWLYASMNKWFVWWLLFYYEWVKRFAIWLCFDGNGVGVYYWCSSFSLFLSPISIVKLFHKWTFIHISLSYVFFLPVFMLRVVCFINFSVYLAILWFFMIQFFFCFICFGLNKLGILWYATRNFSVYKPQLLLTVSNRHNMPFVLLSPFLLQYLCFFLFLVKKSEEKCILPYAYTFTTCFLSNR